MPKKHYKLCKSENANKNQVATVLLGSGLTYQKTNTH